MRVELRSGVPALVPFDPGVFSYPVGVSELTGWLKTLPPPPVRSDRAHLGECLRARIRSEELLARCYEAAQRALLDEGGWAGGPSLHLLQRMENEVLLHARELREACADLGEPSDQLPRPREVGPLGLVRVIALFGSSLRLGLEGLALAELSAKTGWLKLSHALAQQGLEDLASDLERLPAENASRLGVLRRWIALAPEPVAALD